MLRQLITLLAIVTGLAAAGAPANARISGFDGVQVEASGERTPACEVQQSFAPALQENSLSAITSLADPGLDQAEEIAAPTVHVKVDRARE